MATPFDFGDEVTKAINLYRAGMGLKAMRTPDSPCWPCGTSEDRYDLCSGCAAALIQEAKRDRDSD